MENECNLPPPSMQEKNEVSGLEQYGLLFNPVQPYFPILAKLLQATWTPVQDILPKREAQLHWQAFPAEAGLVIWHPLVSWPKIGLV